MKKTILINIHNSVALISIFFILINAALNAQSSSVLENKIINLISESSLKGATVGICAINMSDKQEIIKINAEQKMIPASSLKIITSFMALEKLGFDHQFQTIIAYSGNIGRDNILNGDIYIIGSGDPSLGSSRIEIGKNSQEVLQEIITSIRNSGITCIDGDIIIDGNIFDKEYAHHSWPWNDVGNYYGGGVAGINFNENEYKIEFARNSKIGALVKINRIYPTINKLKIRSEVILDKAGTGDNAYIYGGPGGYYKIIRGSIPSGNGGFTIRGSIPDPPMFFGTQLYDMLAKGGIRSNGYRLIHKKGSEQNRVTTLNKIVSPTLEELVKLGNFKSINLFCEAFLKAISKNGSRISGISEINKKLADFKIDTFGIKMVDGSGLSPRNGISPMTFCKILDVFISKWGVEKSTSFLPRVGYEGTVRNFLKKSPVKGKAYLKSGYIEDVITYAGYLKNKNGNWVSISVMVNDYRSKSTAVRQQIENIITEIYLF